MVDYLSFHRMTKETCDTCGLPPELCICEEAFKEDQTVTIDIEERSFEKQVTVVSGLDPADIDVSTLCSELKSAFGCGGTVHDDGTMELQGDHRSRVRTELDNRGYAVAQHH
jgi:translation initiation factor 1